MLATDHSALVPLGIAAQLSGFAVTAWDLMDTRRRYEKYRRRPHMLEAIVARGRGTASNATLSIGGGDEPTAEQRLAQLEAGVARLEQSQRDQVSAVRDKLEGAAN